MIKFVKHISFKNLPLVSILIPNKKGREVRCIDSIKNQTYKNIEYLVSVDTDHGKNWAINQKIGDLTGKYLFICDDDITLDRFIIEKMVRILEDNEDISFVYCDYARTGLHTGVLKSKEFNHEILRDHNYISEMALVRMKDNVSRDESILKYTDWDFWRTLSDQGKKGKYLPEVLFSAYYGKECLSNMPSKELKKWNEKICLRHPRQNKPMVTFAKYTSFENIEFKKEAKLYFNMRANWMRYWSYPFIKRNIDFKDKKILDVGGGNCVFADYLNPNWEKYDILDKNPKGEITKSHTKYIVGDITETVLKEKYDIVLNLSVLEHIKEWKKALKNMDAMLKIGGRLILTPAFFSIGRQFGLEQIPELLTQLKNYDLGEIDLSLNDSWCSDYVKKYYPDKFIDKRFLVNQKYNSIELYIEGIKKSEMENVQTNFEMDRINPTAL